MGTGHPKILFLDQTGQLGGAELVLLDLAQHCRTRAEVLLFTDGPLVPLLQARGVTVAVLPAGRALLSMGRKTWLPAPSAVWDLMRQARHVAVRAEGFELIHCNTQKAFLVGAFAGWLAHRLVIYHLHDILTADHFSLLNRMIAVLLANRLVVQILANSLATRDAFIRAGGRPDLVQVLYNGVDPLSIEEAQPISGLREQLGIGPAPLFALVGRLSPWKGQHIVIEALSQVPEAHVLLVGEALFGEHGYADRLRQQVQRLGLQQRVHFLGHRSDVASLLKSIDGLVHASTAPEPFGRVLVEGMMAGLPVVATAAGGVLEIVRDGETGRLVEPASPSALAAVLKSWCHSAEQRRQLGEAGKHEALQRFALHDMLARFDQSVMELMQG